MQSGDCEMKSPSTDAQIAIEELGDLVSEINRAIETGEPRAKQRSFSEIEKHLRYFTPTLQELLANQKKQPEH
jgi:ArsR family metal-binding transcriptional regulator